MATLSFQRAFDENPLKICGLSGLYMSTILVWLLYHSSKPVDENPLKISGRY